MDRVGEVARRDGMLHDTRDSMRIEQARAALGIPVQSDDRELKQKR